MRLIRANIWTYWPEHWIVIPTNIGWKKNGENVMGRGLAAQAAERFPTLPTELGQWYRSGSPKTGIGLAAYHQHHVICFPVKPLAEEPSMSWRQRASLDLIEDSCKELRALVSRWGWCGERIAMPMVGCGNGGLKREEVLPILERHLGDLPNLILVDQN